MVNERTTRVPATAGVDPRLEVVVLPVSDVDRAKRFYWLGPGSLPGRLRDRGCTRRAHRPRRRDPDGNRWLLQEVKTRLAGRGLGNSDVATLTKLLREAEKHHGEYEPTAPKHHWSGWYATYIISHARAARLPRRQPKMLRSAWKVPVDEGRRRLRRSISRLRAAGPPRQTSY